MSYTLARVSGVSAAVSAAAFPLLVSAGSGSPFAVPMNVASTLMFFAAILAAICWFILGVMKPVAGRRRLHVAAVILSVTAFLSFALTMAYHAQENNWKMNMMWSMQQNAEPTEGDMTEPMTLEDTMIPPSDSRMMAPADTKTMPEEDVRGMTPKKAVVEEETTMMMKAE